MMDIIYYYLSEIRINLNLSESHVIYILWFLLFYLIPVMIFLRLNRINIELLELKGFRLTPKLLNGNVVSISSNYSEFINENPKLKKSNIIFKIFKNICSEAENGNSYSPNLYISSYKASLRKFVLWILLGSHIPFIFLLFVLETQFSGIIRYQACCYILIYILEMMLQYKSANFSKIFYSKWYNKILNFDLLTVRLIRNDVEQIRKLSNSHDLLDAVVKFEEANASLADKLSSHTETLSCKFDELINMQQKMNGINSQSVLLSLDDSISKYREINAHIQAISENIRNSFESIISLSKYREDEINAINKNTELLSDIRERFKNYQSEAFNTELEQLQAITVSLDNNISRAFVSASSIITQNFEKLEEGYDKFFDLCKALREAMSDNYEEKTATALKQLFSGLESEFAGMRKQTERSIEIIEGTSQATELLCKTVYEFNQFIMAPGFIGKISRFGNFSGRLKDAADKLISYEKLASLAGDKEI